MRKIIFSAAKLLSHISPATEYWYCVPVVERKFSESYQAEPIRVDVKGMFEVKHGDAFILIRTPELLNDQKLGDLVGKAETFFIKYSATKLSIKTLRDEVLTAQPADYDVRLSLEDLQATPDPRDKPTATDIYSDLRFKHLRHLAASKNLITSALDWKIRMQTLHPISQVDLGEFKFLEELVNIPRAPDGPLEAEFILITCLWQVITPSRSLAGILTSLDQLLTQAKRLLLLESRNEFEQDFLNALKILYKYLMNPWKPLDSNTRNALSCDLAAIFALVSVDMFNRLAAQLDDYMATSSNYLNRSGYEADQLGPRRQPSRYDDEMSQRRFEREQYDRRSQYDDDKRRGR